MPSNRNSNNLERTTSAMDSIKLELELKDSIINNITYHIPSGVNRIEVKSSILVRSSIATDGRICRNLTIVGNEDGSSVLEFFCKYSPITTPVILLESGIHLTLRNITFRCDSTMSHKVICIYNFSIRAVLETADDIHSGARNLFVDTRSPETLRFTELSRNREITRVRVGHIPNARAGEDVSVAAVDSNRIVLKNGLRYSHPVNSAPGLVSTAIIDISPDSISKINISKCRFIDFFQAIKWNECICELACHETEFSGNEKGILACDGALIVSKSSFSGGAIPASKTSICIDTSPATNLSVTECEFENSGYGIFSQYNSPIHSNLFSVNNCTFKTVRGVRTSAQSASNSESAANIHKCRFDCMEAIEVNAGGASISDCVFDGTGIANYAISRYSQVVPRERILITNSTFLKQVNTCHIITSHSSGEKWQIEDCHFLVNGRTAIGFSQNYTGDALPEVSIAVERCKFLSDGSRRTEIILIRHSGGIGILYSEFHEQPILRVDLQARNDIRLLISLMGNTYSGRELKLTIPSDTPHIQVVQSQSQQWEIYRYPSTS